MTKADQAHRAAEETAAFFGQDNLEQLGEVYQSFVRKVDVRALLAWKLPDGLDELLLPVFRAALLVITGELRLGEVTEQLDERHQLRAENERLKAELAKRECGRPKAKPVRQYRFPGDAMSAPHDEPQL